MENNWLRLNKLIIKGLFSLLSVSALANSDPTTNIMLTEADSSLKFLSMVFGSMNGLLPNSPILLINVGIKYLNLGLIAFIAGIISYTYTTTAIKTSNQGKFLGKQGGGITAAFRSFTSVSVLAPIPAYNGYALLQVMIIKIVISGVGLANNVWHEVTKIVDQQGSIISADQQGMIARVQESKQASIEITNDTLIDQFAFCMSEKSLNYSSKISDDRTKVTFEEYEQASQTANKGENKKSCPKLELSLTATADASKLSLDPLVNYVKQTINLFKLIHSKSDDLINLPQGMYYEFVQLNKKILTQSYLGQLKKIEKENEAEKNAPIAWFDSWIFAAANYTKLMGDVKYSGTKIIKLKAELSDMPDTMKGAKNKIKYERLLIAPNNSENTDNSNDTKQTTPKKDVYLNAITTIMPKDAETTNEKWESFLKKLNADTFVNERIREDRQENRSQKTLSAGGDDFLSSMANMLTSAVADNWDLGMLTNTFSLDKGPYNLTARDKVLTRDIQLFMMQIYQIWKVYIEPSNVRAELSPLSRLRAFGLSSTNIGIEFIANIVQDTFFAAIGAQMEAQKASIGYIAKSFLFKGVTSGIFIAANTFLSSFVLSFMHPILIIGAAVSQGLSAYYTMQSAIPGLFAPLVVASKVMYITLAVAAALPVILLGLLFAIYVVFIPFLVFLFSVIGWVMTVIEAVLAAPIVASGMANPQGHDFLGKSQQLIMLLASVFIRPVCIIIGFIMAVFLFNSAVDLLDFAYFPFIDSYVGNANHMGISLAVIMLMYAYGYLVFCLVRFCFSLTFVLPNYIVRWIGMMPVSGGEEEAMESIESSMKEAYSSGLSGAYGGVGMMKR